MSRLSFSSLLLLLFVLLLFPVLTAAQTSTPTPQVIAPAAKQPLEVAGQSKLYCAGYIRLQRLPHLPEIVGALEEQEQRTFSDGEIVYLNAGSKQVLKKDRTSRSFARAATLRACIATRKAFSVLTFRKSAS